VREAQVAVLTGQAALQTALATLILSGSAQAMRAALAAVAAAHVTLLECLGEDAGSPGATCPHCGSGTLLESVTAGGRNVVCGDCGKGPDE
jgi:hypothetical protein